VDRITFQEAFFRNFVTEHCHSLDYESNPSQNNPEPDGCYQAQVSIETALS
jgi:hypothetical protein